MPRINPRAPNWIELDWTDMGIVTPDFSHDMAAIHHWLQIYKENGLLSTPSDRIRQIEQQVKQQIKKKTIHPIRRNFTNVKGIAKPHFSMSEVTKVAGLFTIGPVLTEAIRKNNLVMFGLYYNMKRDAAMAKVAPPEYFVMAKDRSSLCLFNGLWGERHIDAGLLNAQFSELFIRQPGHVVARMMLMPLKVVTKADLERWLDEPELDMSHDPDAFDSWMDENMR